MIEVRLREWSTAPPDEGSALAGGRLDGAEERRLTEELARAGRLTIEELAAGLRVTSTSFVGRLQIGSLVVTIEPKLAKEPLLALVRYAYGLRDVVREGTTSFATSGALLPDLLAAQLLGEITELLARGLPRRYVERSEELSLPRGRIDVAALARRATPSMTLPCRHHPRSADHPLLQIVKAGLELAAEMASDRPLRIALRRLADRLGLEVESVPLTRVGLIRVQRGLTRLEAAAEPTLELIGLILDGQAITLDDETTVRLPGFLFDMNRFFQALVGRWLREHLPDCHVIDERALTGLLRYAPDANPKGRRAPAPRPDFAVARKHRKTVLLDAKYRDLWEKALPREMLYQLAMYATSGAGEDVAVILYPTENDHATEARVEIRDVVGGGARGGVALRPVALPRLAGLIEGEFEERSAEARRLAFG
jgi:5-methylcytosine-specific restriction enzyme subunit McrC